MLDFLQFRDGWDILQAAAWLVSLALLAWMLWDAIRVSQQYSEDVVADNCSSAGLVVGAWSRKFDALDNAGVRMQINGRNVQVGSTAAILGQPLRSIVQASRLLHGAGMSLPAGSLIMAGAATAAEALAPGMTVECHIGSGRSSLGSVMFHTGA